MNEFLLLALVVIYLTISYPPKSKQPDSNDGERTRRFFGFIGGKPRKFGNSDLSEMSLTKKHADPSSSEYC